MIKGQENLIPCKPGETHNPAGKPKGTKSLKTTIRKYLAQTLKADHKIMVKLKDEKLVDDDIKEMSLFDIGILKMVADYVGGDDKARRDIFDRLYGKVPDNLEINTGDRLIIEVSSASKAEIEGDDLVEINEKKIDGNTDKTTTLTGPVD